MIINAWAFIIYRRIYMQLPAWCVKQMRTNSLGLGIKQILLNDMISAHVNQAIYINITLFCSFGAILNVLQ